jgi:hypothetical protein
LIHVEPTTSRFNAFIEQLHHECCAFSNGWHGVSCRQNLRPFMYCHPATVWGKGSRDANGTGEMPEKPSLEKWRYGVTAMAHGLLDDDPAVLESGSDPSFLMMIRTFAVEKLGADPLRIGLAAPCTPVLCGFRDFRAYCVDKKCRKP